MWSGTNLIRGSRFLGTLIAAFGFSVSAHAEMVISPVIVDLQPNKPSREDIEVWNSSGERMYVVAEPFEIEAAGLPEERRVAKVEPADLGLLVSPRRLVLEPGQRRIIRVAAIAQRGDIDRVYRLTIKPVAGGVDSEASALRILLGYDALVLYRADKISGKLNTERDADRIVFHNNSNTAHELFDGEQCDDVGQNCKKLEGTRLYPGAIWEHILPYDTPVEYQVSTGQRTVVMRF